MSLLSIITTVCEELSLVVPTTVIGSTDRQIVQLKALANRAGKTMARKYAWQAIRKEIDFSTLAQQQQNGFMPADFDRFVPNSMFNRSTRRPVTGPLTPRQYQWIQAQPVYASVYLAFIERQNQILVVPNPAANQTIACEYVSINWCQSAQNVAQSSFQADTDTVLIDEDVLTLGVIWRWLRRKGLDYAEEMDDYERDLEELMARDGGSTALSLAPQPVDLNRVNVPDGNFGA